MRSQRLCFFLVPLKHEPRFLFAASFSRYVGTSNDSARINIDHYLVATNQIDSPLDQLHGNRDAIQALSCRHNTESSNVNCSNESPCLGVGRTDPCKVFCTCGGDSDTGIANKSITKAWARSQSVAKVHRGSPHNIPRSMRSEPRAVATGSARVTGESMKPFKCNSGIIFRSSGARCL